ncbi:N-acyl homoserine lactonase family protein [Asticcacaulis sp. SL142]|uniref:N-acyl homoserine lactonase family protein n=1 Tax=Asticcacaulis sp. SL142 TaxID=2995155 RepID=UPI00226CE0BD|nr:N-acyl homoserine lactonase family protein [Asticcacaulis sp. SL142]WAC48266.1 N-acyl homoserine lactonase family protein [Asticcacaulis sp. SL142]
MTTDVRRLFVLLCGFEFIPKTVSTKDRGGRFILSAPVCAYLLDTSHGWVMLDCGMNEDTLADPDQVRKKFLDLGLMPPVVRRDHRLDRQFEAIGIGYEDVKHVILSHLHLDHCGSLKRFRHARISLQRREFDYAFSEYAGFAYFREDYSMPDMDWDLKDGDWDAMPGLELLDTAGHTPGHQSAIITLPSGQTIVLPFDAGDLQENFDHERLPGECSDEVAALAAIRRLKSLTVDRSAKMILFHDPVQIQSIRLAPEFYE